MICEKASFFRNAGRIGIMMREGNFSGLGLQLMRALKLRGPVPLPAMPEPEASNSSVAAGVPLARLPIKVLLFSHDLNLEGAAISLFELTLELQKKGVVHPEVLALENGPLRERYEQ